MLKLIKSTPDNATRLLLSTFFGLASDCVHPIEEIF